MALTIPVSAETAADGRIQPGSTVRVLATVDKGKPVSRVAAVAAGGAGGAGGSRSLHPHMIPAGTSIARPPYVWRAALCMAGPR